jgi:hypothetical protein
LEIEVLVPAWKFNQGAIVLPGEETDIDLLFAEKGDAEYDETHTPSWWTKEKPALAVGDEVTVRFT